MPFERDDSTWSKHVRAGEAFSAEDFLVGVGGTVALLQLFNPVASGIRVRLRSVHAIGNAAQAVNVRRHDVALATLGPPAGFVVENLLGGAAANVGEIRSAQPAAAVGTIFWQLNAPANTPAIYPPEGREWGHDLLEGQGVLLQAAAGVTLIVNWQWVEVPL